MRPCQPRIRFWAEIFEIRQLRRRGRLNNLAAVGQRRRDQLFFVEAVHPLILGRFLLHLLSLVVHVIHQDFVRIHFGRQSGRREIERLIALQAHRLTQGGDGLEQAIVCLRFLVAHHGNLHVERLNVELGDLSLRITRPEYLVGPGTAIFQALQDVGDDNLLRMNVLYREEIPRDGVTRFPFRLRQTGRGDSDAKARLLPTHAEVRHEQPRDEQFGQGLLSGLCGRQTGAGGIQRRLMRHTQFDAGVQRQRSRWRIGRSRRGGILMRRRADLLRRYRRDTDSPHRQLT